MLTKAMQIGKNAVALCDLNFAIFFNAKNIRNLSYFNYTTDKHMDQKHIQKHIVNTVPYCHFYFDQNVKGFEKISPAAIRIKQRVSTQIYNLQKKYQNAEQKQKLKAQTNPNIASNEDNSLKNESETKEMKEAQAKQKANNLLKEIIQKSVILMAEEIALEAKSIFDYMNEDQRNPQYQKRKITSIWEIRKMIERQILWSWKRNIKEVNYKIYKMISKEFCEIYEIYAAKILQTIVKEGKKFQGQDPKQTLNNKDQANQKKDQKQIKSLGEYFKSLGDHVLQSLKLLKQQRTNKINKEDPKLKERKEKTEKYFFQGFEARFKPTQNIYWQNNLQKEQSRFQQQRIDSKKEYKFGLVYLPTFYTYHLVLRAFKEWSFQYNLDIRLIQSSYDVRYRYLQGLKFNGKSISVIMLRDLSSYLIQKTVLTIPNIQFKGLNQFTNFLCCALTRDLWTRLSSQNMANIQSIWRQEQFSQEQKLKNKFIQNQSNKILRMARKINAQIDGNYRDQQCQKIVKRWVTTQYQEILFFRDIVDIVNKVSPNLIIIDQFNYFGRNIYELLNLQKSPVKSPTQSSTQSSVKSFQQTLTEIAKMMYFTSLIFKQNRFMCLLASINNYPYLNLINLIIKVSKDRHIQTKLVYLNQEKQMARKVVEFLNIYVFYQKDHNINKKNKIKNLILGQKLFKALQNADTAFNMRECQNIAKEIYKESFLQIDEEKEEENQNIIINIVNNAIKQEKKKVKSLVDQGLNKLIQERKFTLIQTLLFVQELTKCYKNTIQEKKLQNPIKRQQQTNNLFKLIQDRFYPDNSKRIFNLVNQEKIFHKGYKNIFADIFEETNTLQLAQKLFPQLKKKQQQDFIREIISQWVNSMKDLDDINIIDAIYSTIKAMFGNFLQNRFGRFFKQKSKMANSSLGQIQFVFKQIQKIDLKVQERERKFKLSQVVYEKNTLQKTSLFKELKKSYQTMEENKLYVFRTKHLTKKMDYILTFKKDNIVNCFFTEIGLNKFKQFLPIGRQFNSSYKNEIQNLKLHLKKKDINFISKFLVLSLQETKQDEESVVQKFEKQVQEKKDKQILNQINFSILQKFFIYKQDAQIFQKKSKQMDDLDKKVKQKKQELKKLKQQQKEKKTSKKGNK